MATMLQISLEAQVTPLGYVVNRHSISLQKNPESHIAQGTLLDIL